MSKDEVRKHPEFTVHMLNDEGKKKAGRIAHAFDKLLTELEGICSQSCREFAIVKTKLEEASFFSKKSMALDPDNQEKS